jgi:hypothetical protein
VRWAWAGMASATKQALESAPAMSRRTADVGTYSIFPPPMYDGRPRASPIRLYANDSQ